jgi:dolichol-phosphate mannosyltransferase
VASRYIRGGSAKMPKDRFLLSRFLNFIFKFGLELPVSDLSSGYRLYKTEVVKTESFAALDFSILQEILVRIHSAGLRIKEVPFDYAPRRSGSSNARVLRFGYSYAKMFISILSKRIMRKRDS